MSKPRSKSLTKIFVSLDFQPSSTRELNLGFDINGFLNEFIFLVRLSSARLDVHSFFIVNYPYLTEGASWFNEWSDCTKLSPGVTSRSPCGSVALSRTLIAAL